MLAIPRSRAPWPPSVAHQASASWPAAFTTALAIVAASPLPAALGAEPARATATGTLTTAGTATALDHIRVDVIRGDWMVLVSDRALGPGCDAFSGFAIAEKEPFTGLLFEVDGETLTLGEGTNALIHPGLSAGEGFRKIQRGLALARGGDGFARGKLVDTIVVGEQSFDVTIDLALPLDAAPAPIAPRTVRGADSKPAQRFAALVDAVVAGRLDEVKSLSTADMEDKLAQVPPEEAAEQLASFADFLLPRTITITGSEVDGDRAVLTATGESQICRGKEQGEGRIELAREGREWKVAAIKFEMRETSE